MPDFITFRDISRRIPVSEKTLRNKASLGTLPFQTVLIMGKRAVRSIVFEEYLNSLSSIPVFKSDEFQGVTPEPLAKKRGRPTKANQIARLKEGRSQRHPSEVSRKNLVCPSSAGKTLNIAELNQHTHDMLPDGKVSDNK